MLDATIMPKKK